MKPRIHDKVAQTSSIQCFSTHNHSPMKKHRRRLLRHREAAHARLLQLLLQWNSPNSPSIVRHRLHVKRPCRLHRSSRLLRSLWSMFPSQVEEVSWRRAVSRREHRSMQPRRQLFRLACMHHRKQGMHMRLIHPRTLHNRHRVTLVGSVE